MEKKLTEAYYVFLPQRRERGGEIVLLSSEVLEFQLS
jgi:hypothetical protein